MSAAKAKEQRLITVLTDICVENATDAELAAIIEKARADRKKLLGKKSRVPAPASPEPTPAPPAPRPKRTPPAPTRPTPRAAG